MQKHPYSLIGPVYAATFLALAGCQWPIGGRLDVWVAEADRQVFPDTPREADNDVYTASRALITLAGAINETVCFQLVFPGGSGGDAITAVRPGDLAGSDRTIAAEHFAVFREHRIPVDSYPAWYYERVGERRSRREFGDVLIPVIAGSAALPAELEPGRNLVLWVDLRIPAGTSPGSYRGEIEVRARSNASARLTVEVEVYPFAIPDTPHVTALAPMRWSTLVAHHLEQDGKPYRPTRLAADDPLRPAALEVLDAAFQLLRRHRCNGLLTDLYPQRRPGDGGQPVLDWTDYDTVSAGYLDGSAFADRVPVPLWALPVDERYPPTAAYGGPGAPAYADAVRHAADAALAHARQRGWLNRHVVLLHADGHHRGDEYATYQPLAEILRSAQPGLRIWCDLPPQSMVPFGWAGHGYTDLGRLINVWCPPARFADPSTMATLRKAGALAWWQPDVPPYSGSLAIVSPPVDVRCVAWQATRWPSDAIWLSGAADWPAEPSRRAIATEVRAETPWLIYPGREFGVAGGPIPSIRLKRLRNGLQDAEYLWLLRQQGRPAIADLVAESLFAFGGADAYGEQYADGRAYGWVRDPAMWRLGRRLLATELKRAASGEPTESFEQFRQRLEWQQFLLGTRRVTAWVDGVRLRAEAVPDGGAIRAEAVVSMLNQGVRAAAATAGCAAPPAGWKADAPSRFEVPPGRLAKRTLTLRTLLIEPDAGGGNGIIPLPIVLEGGADFRLELPGRLAVIHPQALTRPVRVDGRLDDWPPAFGNAAGDFILVGAQDVPRRGPGAPDRPSQATLAFVCHDDDSMYIAFNCEDPQAARREVAETNFVRYEGMTPTGEDLVEVLLDPGASAAGPGDLYHLVVKANGAVVTERGIGCSPPIGPHRHWPAEVRVGIDAKSLPDRWLVEVQVRWSSFDEGARRHRLWGINFARLHSRTGEYSTWSGARWNVYTPTTLGNMVLSR